MSNITINQQMLENAGACEEWLNVWERFYGNADVAVETTEDWGEADL